MDPFTHIKSVLAIVLGLSLAHLIQTSLNLLLQRGKKKPYWVQMLWVFYTFLLILHFWWWEYNLTGIKVWTFLEYLFVTLYIINYYAIAYVIFPNNITEYEDSYKTYFYARKNWFFSFLGFSFLLDVINTLMKGRQYFSHSGAEYDFRIPLSFVLCLFGIKFNNKTFQASWLYSLSYMKLYIYPGPPPISAVNSKKIFDADCII